MYTPNHESRKATLPVLAEKERQQVVVEWNDTKRDFPEDQCIHQLFEAQAERTPEAYALVFEAEHMTYRELNARANQLAHYLRRVGVGPDVRVGICMERSLEMLVAMLGILKAGGAYVPLDSHAPRERLAFLLRDAQPILVLTHQAGLANLAELTSSIVLLENDWQQIALESTDPIGNVAHPADLVYVIYTSGSTGEPKGVLVTHHNLVNATLARITYHEPITSLLLVNPFIFDASVGSIFGTLCQGGTLILPSVGAELEMPHLARLIEQHQITHFVWATALYAHFLENATPHQLSSLRAITIGGESCPKVLVERHYELLPKVSLFNDYGPTECTIWSSVYHCQPQRPGNIVPIGRPIANVRMYILDADLQPVPIGAPGELYIGGAGVARGYLNRPELTTERFIPDPFSQKEGALLYKTGDIARYAPDSQIEFLHRVDQQVKLRGLRIEPEEVRAAILKHCPDVREAAVMLREITPGNQSLVAYLVPVPMAYFTPSQIRQQLSAHLPEYMLPGAFVMLGQLPLSSTGKIDYAALSAMQIIIRGETEPFVAPTNIVQYQLLDIWEGLLEARPISIKDNFFLLGGHSLLAARLITHIEQVFGQKLEFSTLFEGPTVEQLAEVLQQQELHSISQPILAVQTGGTQRPFFFLHGNWKGEAFYCFRLAHALGPDQPFYALGTHNVGAEKSLPTVESIAAAAIALLRSIQPEGPYLLGGYCNGGLLAYEMACQLSAQGEQIDLLALIGPSMAEADAFKGLSSVINGPGKLLRLNRDTRGDIFLHIRHALRHLYRALFPSDKRLRDFPKLLAIDPRFERMFPPLETLRKDYISVLSWIVPDYRPGTYEGKVTCFWPREELFLKDAWHKATQPGSIEDYVLPGTALTVIGPYLNLLVERLKDCLKTVNIPAKDNQDLRPQIAVHDEDGIIEKRDMAKTTPAQPAPMGAGQSKEPQ